MFPRIPCPLKISPLAALMAALLTLSTPALQAALTDSLQAGPAQFQSMNSLAFGPEGILFVADTKAAAIVALQTDDGKASDAAPSFKVEGINQKIAALLGVEADQVLINDLAVNPASRHAYVSVSRGRGPDATPALIRVSPQGKVSLVSLKNIKHATAVLPDAPADREVGEGRRRSNPRQESITDVAYLDGRVLVAGLANEEFASTLRAIPFPFGKIDHGTSVEIYHGAHGRFETRSPVRTFVPFTVGNQPSLLAAYTCTPLVQFPLTELQPNAKIKGTTVAELGNSNRPLDMIVYQKDGKDYLLIANSSRGIMKVSTDNITQVEGITEPVGNGGTKGLSYETIEAWQGIDQLDRLDPKQALVIRRGEGGSLNLESLDLP